MSEFVIVYEALRSQRGRTLLLLLTIAIAFLVYGILGTVRYSLKGGADDVAENRLVVMHQGGLTEPLPMAYRIQLQRMNGVGAVEPVTWFGGYFQSQSNMLMAFAVDPQIWIAQHPDMSVSRRAVADFQETRNGMLVAEALAHEYGWKVGDVVPIKSILFAPRDGAAFWPFKVSGVFRTTESGGGRNYIVMHYEYLNENRWYWQNTTGTFMVTPKRGVDAERLAREIDEQFSTAESRTATATDRAFHSAFFAQFGNITLMIRAIVLVAFVSMLLVVTSTITVTIRQRTKDIGVLKVLGFSNWRILRLVYVETLAIAIVGGVLGLVLASVAISVLSRRIPTIVPDLGLPTRVLIESVAIIGSIGVVAGTLPAVLALRMRPAEAFVNE